MTAIPEDVLAVAAVITGGEQLRLTGQQRLDVIAAAHALGWRQERITAALRLTSAEQVRRLARSIGISLLEPDHDPDWVAIDIVCAGTAMVLHPADRVEAIRQLAPTRTMTEIAALIGCPYDVVCRLATRIGVQPRRAGTPRRPARQPVAA